MDRKAVKSVVTPLRATPSKAKPASEPEVDLQELLAALEELPTMDATKVVALNRCIENGDYKIDVQRLAEKMLELESSIDPD